MKLLLIGAGLGIAIAVWFGYFWLEEQRRWAQPVPLRRGPSVSLDRCRRVL